MLHDPVNVKFIQSTHIFGTLDTMNISIDMYKVIFRNL